MLKLKNLSLKSINAQNSGSFFFNLMRFGFFFYLLFFALGIAPREIGATISLIGLVGYYSLSYNDSNLKKIGALKWTYFLFIAFLFFKIFHNIDIPTGWYGFKTNVRKAFILIFVGMEVVRSTKDLKILTAIFAFMGFYEGLDGIYQYITGVDFIRGTEMYYSRLTGSLKTPRVGNLMSMVIPISLGVWILFPSSWSRQQKTLTLSLIIAPPIFLFAGAKTGSAATGLLTALTVMFVFLKTKPVDQRTRFTALLIAFPLFILFFLGLIFLTKGYDIASILNTARMQELWPHAIAVFKSAPFLGVGINGYNPAVHSLGLEFKICPPGIPHPHNIYLQFLAETGIVGTSIFFIFISSFLLFALRTMIPFSKKRTIKTDYILTCLFFSSFAGYLVTAISAHNFFRTWWLGMAFSILGILTGATLMLKSKTDKKN